MEIKIIFQNSPGEFSNVLADWAAISSFLLTLLITLSGLIFFWPRFKRQKKIESANQNSWKALDLLDFVEEFSISLFWAYKIRKINNDQYIIQSKLLISLKKLQTGFFVLKETDNKTMTEHLNWIENIIHRQKSRDQAIRKEVKPPHRASYELLNDLGLGSYNSEEPNLSKFDKIRKDIAAIAGYHNKRKNKTLN